MIFATCGSSPLPFTRMMDVLASLPGEDLCVQHGPAPPPPSCAFAYEFLPFGDVIQRLDTADVVVSHAGVGSIMCAMRAGHVPVVFPRLKRFDETVDDHQAELADALAQRGSVIVAWTAEELLTAIATVPPRTAGRTLDADQLGMAVRAAVRGPRRRGRRLHAPLARPHARV